jgi:predicted polyphosphate/ATP-dependent NAD kinase
MGCYLAQLSKKDRSDQGMKKTKIGLIVNPVAGIGGAVGLKGSDGVDIQRQARSLGAESLATIRTVGSLAQLATVSEDFTILTYPGEMGEEAVRQGRLEPVLIGEINPGHTTAQDTRRAAAQMCEIGVELIVFAGGDGTARDLYSVVGTEIPVVGIPAGVKMHSAVFANSPVAAGNLVRAVLEGRIVRYREAEVMDLDEDSYRKGRISPRLYGFLKVPLARALVQGPKIVTRRGEEENQAAIAAWVVESMERGRLYILGPGTTTRAVASKLALEKTLVGVDVVMDGELILVDANERQLLELLGKQSGKIAVTPIGGQGHLFGRGNQQISHRVISQVGRENLLVLCTPDKLHSIQGRPLLVDTGNRSVDKMLRGFIRVITGYGEQAVYRVNS